MYVEMYSDHGGYMDLLFTEINDDAENKCFSEKTTWIENHLNAYKNGYK